MRTFVATKNLGKLAEMRAIFAGSALELETYPSFADVIEGAETYTGNARLKAAALRAQLIVAGVQGAVIADDSGLEAAALNGRPGVFSACYAGVDATWTVRRQELLDEIRATRSEDRSAKFVCAMVLLLPDGTEIDALGEIRGRIVEQIRGESGFGYDPLFVADGDTRTFAELSEQEKNATSHRGRAAAALLAALSDRRV
ncbi:MAG TPA: non-canonical purine NTP pyrophosphatase [Verrucomicrobiae bacterium]|nr:non-canonical purine NTP pyrophosphatase [Verrucomicrobiae bacterium]